MNAERLMPRHGGYRRLKTYQLAELIHDITVRFCERYVDRFSRTRDQMVQAARSGKQNIAEGSMASGTSKGTELRLTGVARASLEELRVDYGDFVRQRGLPQWPLDDPRRQELVDRRPRTVDDFAAWVRACRGHCGPGGPETEPFSSTRSTESTRSTKSVGSTAFPSSAEVAANGALTLLRVACTLLDRQLASLGEAFERDGGFRERLYRVRAARPASGGRPSRR